MYIFFKNRKDFKTISKSIPQFWDLPIYASTSESGSLTIRNEGRKDYSNDLVYILGHLFLIEESTPENGTISLKLNDPAMLFSRQLIYPDNPESTFGAFIAARITDEFINCSDTAYRIPYLTVVNNDSTEFIAPELQDDKLYSLYDVICQARENGVIIDFLINGSQLKVHIYTNTNAPHNIFFSDGHAELSSESFSNVKVAKITVLKAVEQNSEEIEEESGQEYESSDWYLSSTGEVSNTVPSSRAEGDWEYLTISSDEDPEEKAKAKFKENISSHKIEFYSDRKYQLWDTVKFKIDGELFESKIVAVFVSSKYSKYLYRCGDLPTTLTEKVQKMK